MSPTRSLFHSGGSRFGKKMINGADFAAVPRVNGGCSKLSKFTLVSLELIGIRRAVLQMIA
jgi:hypothetical protein